MPAIEAVRVVRIPWEKARAEYDGWTTITQGESYVVTYLLKHPEFLEAAIGEDGLKLGGTEFAIPDPSRKGGYSVLDLIYLKGRKYVVVEAKHDSEKDAIAGALYYARLLQQDFDTKEHGVGCDSILPVAALLTGFPPEAPSGYQVGQHL